VRGRRGENRKTGKRESLTQRRRDAQNAEINNVTDTLGKLSIFILQSTFLIGAID
jgi:hypothetical protein